MSLFTKVWEYVLDVVGDGYKVVGLAAPLLSLAFTFSKAWGVEVISLQEISYAWALLPIVVWLLIAYTRRRAEHLKMIEAYQTSKLIRDRIEKQLAAHIAAGATVIDTPTAAAIWAGTMETGDIQRHLCFRLIKMAINDGSIKNARFAGESQRANMHTKIPLDEFIGYLKARGVLA